MAAVFSYSLVLWSDDNDFILLYTLPRLFLSLSGTILLIGSVFSISILDFLNNSLLFTRVRFPSDGVFGHYIVARLTLLIWRYMGLGSTCFFLNATLNTLIF